MSALNAHQRARLEAEKAMPPGTGKSIFAPIEVRNLLEELLEKRIDAEDARVAAEVANQVVEAVEERTEELEDRVADAQSELEEMHEQLLVLARKVHLRLQVLLKKEQEDGVNKAT